jgi:hypothetical protein
MTPRQKIPVVFPFQVDEFGRDRLEKIWIERPEFFTKAASTGDCVDLFYYPPQYRGHILH